MTSYFNTCDVTVANLNHENVLYFFDVHLCPPTLKEVPPPMPQSIVAFESENMPSQAGPLKPQFRRLLSKKKATNEAKPQ